MFGVWRKKMPENKIQIGYEIIVMKIGDKGKSLFYDGDDASANLMALEPRCSLRYPCWRGSEDRPHAVPAGSSHDFCSPLKL